jgi:hypothetical protein
LLVAARDASSLPRAPTESNVLQGNPKFSTAPFVLPHFKHLPPLPKE